MIGEGGLHTGQFFCANILAPHHVQVSPPLETLLNDSFCDVLHVPTTNRETALRSTAPRATSCKGNVAQPPHIDLCYFKEHSPDTTGTHDNCRTLYNSIMTMVRGITTNRYWFATAIRSAAPRQHDATMDRTHDTACAELTRGKPGHTTQYITKTQHNCSRLSPRWRGAMLPTKNKPMHLSPCNHCPGL